MNHRPCMALWAGTEQTIYLPPPFANVRCSGTTLRTDPLPLGELVSVHPSIATIREVPHFGHRSSAFHLTQAPLEVLCVQVDGSKGNWWEPGEDSAREPPGLPTSARASSTSRVVSPAASACTDPAA